jgi:hypothetical protein|tara:strand:+ start:1588 stop:3099 length:1512 start_codon:yes stop_codon:yes gene_type:complete
MKIGQSGKLVTLVKACAMVVFASCSTVLLALQVTVNTDRKHPEMALFFAALSPENAVADNALDQITPLWRDGYAGIIWDMLRFLVPPQTMNDGVFGPRRSGTESRSGIVSQTTPQEHPSTKVWRRLMGYLEERSGQRFRGDIAYLHQWIWDQTYEPHPEYLFFKRTWYSELDPRFGDFFQDGIETTIRLDEIDWGGVSVNGIPPLEYPATIAAESADYLDDEHVVFGLSVNGIARAYPKRILAWHEMALDRIGGVELTIVYCTLCGTVIPYESTVNREHFKFGTSGLLYRSNKLMFDHETKSLWNTFEGVPVVGPLVGTRTRLTRRSMVTTTWGEWRRFHPETTVLSLETGYSRDYGEGVAYREYFQSNDLMFDVPERDSRLPLKAEIVGVLLEEDTTKHSPLAISVEFLSRRPIYMDNYDGRQLVVLTSAEGATRVYEADDISFERFDNEGHLIDRRGARWMVGEDGLTRLADRGERLSRIPSQRAFWFGWYAQFPATRLVH